MYVKGVGPALAAKLVKLGIRTVGDLLFTLPKRHEDRTKFTAIRELNSGEVATIRGRIIGVENVKTRGKLTLTKAYIDDGNGTATLTFFNQPFLRETFKKLKKDVVLHGLPLEGRFGLEFQNPEWEELDDEKDSLAAGRIVPVYGLTEGLTQRRLRTIVHEAVMKYARLAEETLPGSVAKRVGFRPIRWCIQQAHFPDSESSQVAARRRFVFEEFFYLQFMLAMRRAENDRQLGIGFAIPSGFVDEAATMMPFELTRAQRRVIEEIYSDMRADKPMNRLLQGDVGSGKTAVAASALLAAAKSGYQCALMAPTEILAEQHFKVISSLLTPAGVTIELLLGRMTAQQKNETRARIQAGDVQVAIGTHALIQETVEFKNLGLVIIDEQHRFGVLQRAALIQKGIQADVLVMTATPIPRTLTMTLYGDLQLSVIDEMPPGRRPVITHWKRPGERPNVYNGVRALHEKGRQAYVICPLVMESEKLQAKAAEKMYKQLQQDILPDLQIGLLHGQMRSDEKDEVMYKFREGKLDVLVATTVVEVGVDVPNAGVIVIEDAQRFGLSQLHQLRGRVGRAEHQAYCVLVADAPDQKGAERMEILTKTNDGFLIAEEDLRLRGPGEIYGTKQAGLPDFRFGDLIEDKKVMEEARKQAQHFLETATPQELDAAMVQLKKVRTAWGLAEVA